MELMPKIAIVSGTPIDFVVSLLIYFGNKFLGSFDKALTVGPYVDGPFSRECDDASSKLSSHRTASITSHLSVQSDPLLTLDSIGHGELEVRQWIVFHVGILIISVNHSVRPPDPTTA